MCCAQARQLLRRRRLVERQHHMLASDGLQRGKLRQLIVHVPFYSGLDEKLYRAPDLGWIPTRLGACIVKVGADSRPLIHVAVARHVPFVGMACDDPQHLGFLSADHDRWMRSLNRFGFTQRVANGVEPTVEGHRILGPQSPDDRQRLVQHRHSCFRTGELDSIAAVLGLVPTGTEPEVEPSAADVVDRHRHLRQHCRVAIGDTRDQATHPRPPHHRGHRGKRRPRLQRRSGVVDQPVEVVVVGDRMKAELVGGPPEPFQHRVVDGGGEFGRQQHGRQPTAR